MYKLQSILMNLSLVLCGIRKEKKNFQKKAYYYLKIITVHNLILLSAGSGKRLMPYTAVVPKCFIRIGNTTLIENLIRIVKKASISKIFLVYGKNFYLYKKLNVILIKNRKFKTTNMVYSLFCSIKKFNNNTIVSYTDINFSKNIINKLMGENDYISVIVDKKWKQYWKKRSSNYLDDIETLKINKSGFIENIGQKVVNEKQDVQGQYIGLIKFPKKLINQVKKELIFLYKKKKINNINFEKAYLTDFLNYLIKKGYKLKPIFIEQEWIEIDTVKDYKSENTLRRFKKLNKI